MNTIVRTKHPYPRPPGILWLFIIIFVFISSWHIMDEVRQTYYQQGYQSGIVQGRSFEQVQIEALADLLQQYHSKMYRSKALLYSRTVYQECVKRGVGHVALIAQMFHESGFNEFATGKVGEIGLMQICPFWLKHARELGLPECTERELYDPVNNIRWGVAILKRCINNAGGNLYKALCFYNAGGNWEKGKGYANRVLSLRARFEADMGANSG